MSLLTHPVFLEGVAHHQAGRFEDAGKLYQQLLEENPNDPDLWHFKGLLALHQGAPAEAIRLLGLALVLKPGMPEFLQNLALAHEAAGDGNKAAEIYNKLGNALQELCRFADSLPAYERSVALKPDFVSVVINRGAALDRLGRYAEAAAAFETALETLGQPSEPERILNVANALSGLGRAEEAIAAYDRVLALTPDNAVAHCSRALLLLRLGDMEQGWREYEWRWSREGGFKEPRGQFRQPVWHGETPEQLDGPLLVIAEQGLGDVIQFARYVPLLADRGYDILFETLPELTTLFREGFDHPRIRVIPRVETPLAVEGDLPFAAWVGVMSLPDRFGTIVATVPAQVPYVTVDPEKTARWGKTLSNFSVIPRLDRGIQTINEILDPVVKPRSDELLKVGIVWAGNPKNMNDFARSIPLEMLAPLLAVPDVTFYSLQKGPAAAHDFATGNVIKLGDRLTDFTETAAAILALDLVIAVDTSVAHLAGALGKPVWLMIPTMPDWRWLNEGNGSAWYPTMRIFRQSVRGKWSDVIERVAEAAKELSGNAGF